MARFSPIFQRLLSWCGRLSLFQWSLLFSAAAHACLLTVRMVNPQAVDRLLRSPGLEIILVNAHSPSPPSKAQALAQNHLEGGGDHDNASVRASSLLPPGPMARDGNDVVDEFSMLQEMQLRQMQLLAQAKQQLALLPQPLASKEGALQQNQALEDRRRLYVQQLGEIERRILEQNARPKKRYISPATRQAVFARYYDAVRRKIEETGTRNFPHDAERKLYGELLMEITIQSDGKLLATIIEQSSGQPLLDGKAQAIVRMAGGFGTFPADMRRTADVLGMIARFTFKHDQTLQTDLQPTAP